MTDTPAWTRDLPFLMLAFLFHALLLSVNPSIRWGPLPRAAEKLIPVEFVATAPSSPMLAPIPAGEGKTDAIPDNGPGAMRAEKVKKPAVKPLHRKRRIMTAAQKAALAERKAIVRAARIEASQAKARLVLERAQAVARRRAETAARKAELSRELASLENPDETLASSGAPAPKLGKAAALNDAADPVYDLEREGRDSLNMKAAGGGIERNDGAVSWSIEGPIGNRRLLKRRLPVSPDWVSSRGLDLAVQVKFQVLEDGSVKAGSVIKKTSGFPELDRRAVEALKLWKFEPVAGQAGGAETWGSVTFRFTMG